MSLHMEFFLEGIPTEVDPFGKLQSEVRGSKYPDDIRFTGDKLHLGIRMEENTRPKSDPFVITNALAKIIT